MSQEDVERLDEDDAAVEEKDDEESPDAEGHRFLAAERAMDPAADRAFPPRDRA